MPFSCRHRRAGWHSSCGRDGGWGWGMMVGGRGVRVGGGGGKISDLRHFPALRACGSMAGAGMLPACIPRPGGPPVLPGQGRHVCQVEECGVASKLGGARCGGSGKGVPAALDVHLAHLTLGRAHMNGAREGGVAGLLPSAPVRVWQSRGACTTDWGGMSLGHLALRRGLAALACSCWAWQSCRACSSLQDRQERRPNGSRATGSGQPPGSHVGLALLGPARDRNDARINHSDIRACSSTASSKQTIPAAGQGLAQHMAERLPAHADAAAAARLRRRRGREWWRRHPTRDTAEPAAG